MSIRSDNNSNCSGGNFRLFIINIRSVAFFSMVSMFFISSIMERSSLSLVSHYPSQINLSNFTTIRVTRSVEKFLIGSRSGQKACGDHISTANASASMWNESKTGSAAFKRTTTLSFNYDSCIQQCKCSRLRSINGLTMVKWRTRERLIKVTQHHRGPFTRCIQT